MLRWVRIDDVGDNHFLLEQQVDRFPLPRRERAGDEQWRPSLPLDVRCCSVTKASLSTDSFISAASFQETTRVLTEASNQRRDRQPARLEGERDRRAFDSRRYRPRVTTAMFSSLRSWKKRQPVCSRGFGRDRKPPNANWNFNCVRKAKPKRWLRNKAAASGDVLSSAGKCRKAGASRAFLHFDVVVGGCNCLLLDEPSCGVRSYTQDHAKPEFSSSCDCGRARAFDARRTRPELRQWRQFPMRSRRIWAPVPRRFQ